MSMLEGSNICVLDLETLKSADDCYLCGEEKMRHEGAEAYCAVQRTLGTFDTYTPIGWNRKTDLALSLGCYWDYQDSQFHWFDRTLLYATVQLLVHRQP